MSVLTRTDSRRPWLRGALWLAGLGVFFYASYGFANWLAFRRASVPSMVFEWERQIPFIAWTILPYWSINAFYAASLLLCRTRHELDRHVRQLLTAQIVAVACFILFPLRMTFVRPETDGVPGFMFAVLGGFDRPFNQAPSLHIALAIILAVFYGRHVTPGWRPLIYGWFVLVAASVLTTWQHHFIDIPTGALLGLLALWLWPQDKPSPLARLALTRDARRRRLAIYYGAGAMLAAAAGLWLGGLGLWLLWLGVALGLVAASYAAIGAAGFQKSAEGQHSFAASVLLLPYRVGAWINSRLWTRAEAPASPVMDDVWIGRMPWRRDLASLPSRRLVDLCAELPAPKGLDAYRGFPALDLVPLERETLLAAAEAIETLRQGGPVVVVCALGYGRSAAAIAGWLVRSGRAVDVGAALDIIRRARPRISLDRTRLEQHLATMHELPARTVVAPT